MTSLFGSRRRAAAFAARADETTTGARSAHGHGAAGLDPETDALLELVSALRSVGSTDDRSMPGDAFSADLRERLVTEASTVLVAQRTGLGAGSRSGTATPPGSTTRVRASRRRRFATATATVAILMGGTAGMASAAQDSLPGQALYPVKRSLEKAAVTFSGSTVERGRELLTQASGRLEEVQGLMDAGAAERTQIPGTLDTFNEQAREGAGLLISSYESTDDETAMVTLRNFAASSMDTIEELASTAPTPALTGLGDAAVLMHQVDTAADQACPGCSDLPALPASDVLSLTNAAGVVGLPGAVATPTQGASLPGTDPLAPMLPGPIAGQDLIGVPGTPDSVAPAGSADVVPDTAPGAPAEGAAPPGPDTGNVPDTDDVPDTGDVPDTDGQAPGTTAPEPSTPPSTPSPSEPADPSTPSTPTPDPTETVDPSPTPDATATPDPNLTPEPSPSEGALESPASEQPTAGDDDGPIVESPAGDSIVPTTP